MGLGYVEGITHDDVRHGTVTLFAALDVANGTVLTPCKPKRRHQEFLAFLGHAEANAPEHLDVNLICSNDGTHKHARAKAQLVRLDRRSWAQDRCILETPKGQDTRAGRSC
jgi:hypothetical protein